MGRFFAYIIIAAIVIYAVSARKNYVRIERFTDPKGRSGQNSHNKDILFLSLSVVAMLVALFAMVDFDPDAVIAMSIGVVLVYIPVLIGFLISRRRPMYYAEDLQSFIMYKSPKKVDEYSYDDIESYKIDGNFIYLRTHGGKKVFVSLQNYRPICLLGALLEKERAGAFKYSYDRIFGRWAIQERLPDNIAEGCIALEEHLKDQCLLIHNEAKKAQAADPSAGPFMPVHSKASAGLASNAPQFGSTGTTTTIAGCDKYCSLPRH